MSSDLTEEGVKKEIRSLLNSNTHISTIRSVELDYESFIGLPIPSRMLGYNSTEHFLKSIPDVCTVKGTGPYAEVLLVVNEKIAYNAKMVLEQKVSTPKSAVRKRLPGRRRRDELRSVNQINYSANSFQGGPSNSNYLNTNGNQVTNYPPRVPPPHLVPTPSTSFNVNQRPNFNRLSHPVLVPAGSFKPPQPHTSQISHLVKPLEPTQPNIDRLNQSRPVQPQESQSVVTPTRPTFSPVTVGPKKPLTVDHIKLYQFRDLVKDEEVEEDDLNVPKKVQENLKKLIAKFENGIWCGDLRTQYLKMFKRELLFTEYGYGSLIDMCIALKHIFHYVRPGIDDFKLYDRSKPLPVTVEKTYTIASYDSQLNKTINLMDQAALPELDWSDFKGRIPDDVFKFGENIPRQFLPQTTKAEDSIGVVVMEIYDISKFWFYLREEEDKLNTLMDELDDFYKNSDNANTYSIVPAAVQVGLYCVQIIFGEYHRAKVLKLLPNDQVRLLYIDYGTVETASIKGLCFLHQQFSKLPAQAVRGRLANIIPVEKGHAWPPTSILRFKELLNNRSTQLKVSYVDWSEQYVCGFIADVSDPDNVKYANEVLVNEGHALWNNQTQKPSQVMSKSMCIVQNLHLFPTFQELELGMALNFDETNYYSNIRVPVQYCLPNYFKVDDLSDDSYSEMCEGLMETAKNHRKFARLPVQDKEPPLDLNSFGKFKQDMIDFLVQIGQKAPEICEEHEPEAFSTDSENLSFHNSEREKAENLISRLNLSSGETNYNYKNLSEDDDDDEIFEWSHKHSESNRCDTSSPPFCPWIVNKNRPSDLNIFDNPEAFESLSDTPSPTTPTAEEFFKTLGNKISRNSSFLSENVSQDELQLRNSSNLVTSGTDWQADKLVTSNLDPTSKEFVSTLHLTNPFRQFLNLNDGETVSCNNVENTIAGKNKESLITTVDNETDSDSSEYYETTEVRPASVDTLSTNTLRTREFVENLPSNASSPKSASFQRENFQYPQNSVFSDSSFPSTPSDRIPLPAQFSMPNGNMPVNSVNWSGYSQFNGPPLSHSMPNPHCLPMLRPPPGFHPPCYQTQFGQFGNQVVVPPVGLQNPYSYPHQYGYFRPGVPFVPQRQDFYDRYNEQIFRQLSRNN